MRWRREACRKTRELLCFHVDQSLRTAALDKLGKPLRVSTDCHAAACLQHDGHAAPPADVFIITHDCPSRDILGLGYRIIVYSCVDGPVADPFEWALVCRRTIAAGFRPTEFDLYNNVGHTASGYQYDQVFHGQSEGCGDIEREGSARKVKPAQCRRQLACLASTRTTECCDVGCAKAGWQHEAWYDFF